MEAVMLNIMRHVSLVDGKLWMGKRDRCSGGGGGGGGAGTGEEFQHSLGSCSRITP